MEQKTIRKARKENQQLYDRLSALGEDSQASLEIREIKGITALIMKTKDSNIIYSTMLKQIVREFDGVYISAKGELVIYS